MNDIELRFKQELAQLPDPVQFAIHFPNKIAAALEKVSTSEEANDLRALANMGTAYLRQQLPRIIQDRHERYRLMYPVEAAYLDASVKAGELWIVTENKRTPGRNWEESNSENFRNKISTEEAGFKNSRDATTCERIATLDPQDVEIYKQERITNEEHITISGAERVWHLLNPDVHVANNSGEIEWYTPPEYIEAARSVMGEIDLDPASSDIAQQIVKAKKYYTIDDNGLTKKWKGRIWMNPPYSSGLIEAFIRKYVIEIIGNQGIVLVNNATETRWFDELRQASDGIVFTYGRITYLNRNLQPMNKPLQGQAFLYAGPDVGKFFEVFQEFGWCAKL